MRNVLGLMNECNFLIIALCMLSSFTKNVSQKISLYLYAVVYMYLYLYAVCTYIHHQAVEQNLGICTILATIQYNLFRNSFLSPSLLFFLSFVNGLLLTRVSWTLQTIDYCLVQAYFLTACKTRQIKFEAVKFSSFNIHYLKGDIGFFWVISQFCSSVSPHIWR